jgi:cytochrome c551/c552
MTDEPNAALPEPLAHAMQGVPVEATTNVNGVSSSLTVAPWEPSMPLRADATDGQMALRAAHRAHCSECGPDWLGVAREYAEARVAEAQRARVIEHQERVSAERQLAAAETALADARAEVERLREVVKAVAGDSCGFYYQSNCLAARWPKPCLSCCARAALAARPKVSHG